MVSAGHKSSPDAETALTSLCETYWYPLYGFARRTGLSVEDAQDATQEFFARLLEREFLQAADRERGRFRTFLLTVFKRFLLNENERRHTQKRGGGLLTIPIDAASGENRYRFEPQNDWTAERLFERQWAITLLNEVITRLQTEFIEKGKESLFEACRGFLMGAPDVGKYSEIATQLGMSESALRVAVHRMRERYRELLRLEVAQTVAGPEEVDAEINELRDALQGGNSGNSL